MVALEPLSCTIKEQLFFNDSTALIGQGLLIVEASRSYSDTPHSVGLLRTIDRPVAETFLPNNTQQSQDKDIHAPGGIRTRNPSERAAADLRLRPRGLWDIKTTAVTKFRVYRNRTTVGTTK